MTNDRVLAAAYKRGNDGGAAVAHLATWRNA